MLIKPGNSLEYGCFHPVANKGTVVLMCRGVRCMGFRLTDDGMGYCGLAGKPLEVERAQILGILPDAVKGARRAEKD